MNFADIKNVDVANGPGIRVSLFVSGCTHHCPGCFNEVAQDFSYGQPFTSQAADAIFDMVDKPYISGITLLGGEPMEPANQKELLPFVKEFKARFPHLTVWAFSGYTFEELTGQVPSRCVCEETPSLLQQLDVLVDGEFIAAQKDLNLRFRGSRNQRILDMPTSLSAGRPVWAEEYR